MEDGGMNDLMRRMIDCMEPYEGKDPNVSDVWYCKGCYKKRVEDGVRLLNCSRCKAVRYCSETCQRLDFRSHRKECITIKDLTARMRVQAQELRSCSPFPSDEPENLFETSVGHFWGILDTRDYCRTRGELANELAHMAHLYEVSPLLEMALGHRVELMRLIASDNMGLRDVVPFTLLSLNRDDDCYAFIKYWVPILQNGHDVSERHKNTSRGDWIYPRNHDKREDLLVVLGCDESYLPLAFLAALCIIKLRMIAAHEARIKHFEIFEKTAMGQRLGDAVCHVRKKFVDDEGQGAISKEQEEHVNKYFRIIQENNPTLLPSILNPGPLKGQPAPEYMSIGRPSEAWGVLNDCNRHFVRIPGVQKRIEDIVGENPSYDYDTSR